MGFDGPEGGNAPGFRPTISFSRCRPAKQKVRSDSKATTSKSSEKKDSKEVSKKSNKSQSRRKSSSKPLPAALSQQSDNRLEKLAKKVLNKPRRHSSAAESKSRKVGRPPIPSFTWSDDDDDDDDIPGPVFSKKKDKSSTVPVPSQQSNLVADENNSEKLKSGSEKDTNGSKSSTISKEANPDNERTGVTRQSSLKFSSTNLSQKQSSTSADHKAEPTNEQLNQVIDQLYQEVSDTKNPTTKQFFVVIQQKFHATLTAATKKYIKARVTDLVNGEIVPAKIHAKASRDVKSVPNATHTTATSTSQSNGITTANTASKTKEQPTVPTKTATAAAPTIARPTGPATQAPVLAPVVTATAATTSLPAYPIYAHNPHAYQYPYSAYPYYSPHQGSWPTALPPGFQPPPEYEGYSNAVPQQQQQQQQHGGQQQHQHNCSTSAPKQAPPSISTAPDTSRPSSSASKPNETLGARSNDRSGQLKHVPPIPSHVSLPPSKTERAKKLVREQSTQTEQAKKSQAIDKLYPKKPAAARTTEGVGEGCKLCNKCPCHVTKAPQKRSSKRGVDSLRDDPEKKYDVWDKHREKYTKAAEELEIQADRYRRDIKKRKREFLKEEAKSLKLDKFQSGQYRFLPGGQEMEDQLDSFKSVPVPDDDVKNARAKLFGDSCQPTLTQMFGVSRETEAKEAEGEETNVNVDASEQEKAGRESELLEENSSCDDVVVLQSDNEDSSVVEMTVEDYLDDCSVKDEQLSIQRVEWRNGSIGTSTGNDSLDFNAKHDRSIWGSLVASVLHRDAEANYECGFRRVFSDESETPATEDAQGLEHLLGLFGTAPSPQPSPAKVNMGTPSSFLSSPQAVSSELTQRGKVLAEKVNGQVTADSPCLAKVEAACPQWRENVAFAMCQRDPAEIQDALYNIQQSKARLQRMKEGFLRAYEQQQSALGVFEDSLQESLGRFEKEGTPPMVSAEESEDGQKVN